MQDAANNVRLSDVELAEIQARCARATPGPWKSYVEDREQMSGSDFIMTSGDDIYLTGATKDDQDFIAAARQDIPKLIFEIQQLKTLNSSSRYWFSDRLFPLIENAWRRIADQWTRERNRVG